MKLVPHARQSWRWFSMHAMGWCAALQGAWIATPDDLKAHLAPWAFNAFCAAVLLLGIVGRLVDQGGSDG